MLLCNPQNQDAKHSCADMYKHATIGADMQFFLLATRQRDCKSVENTLLASTF